MTIVKGSFVSVKMANGKTALAVVDKVIQFSPTMVGVNWTGLELIEKDHCTMKLKGKTTLANCTEIPDPAAKSDPIMEKWSLKKEKRGPQMREGYYFSSPLLLNGKKVGELVDEGNGGMMQVYCTSGEIRHQLQTDCKAWEQKFNKREGYSESVSNWYDWYHYYRPTGIDATKYFEGRSEKLDAMTAKHR